MKTLTEFELEKLIGRKSTAAAGIAWLLFFGFILLAPIWLK